MTARRTNRLLAFIAAGGMLSAAFLSSPPANATPSQDAAFLGSAELNQGGCK